MRVHDKPYARIPSPARWVRGTTLKLLLLLATMASASCASSAYRAEPMTVQGTITVQGNEPFTAVILQTPSRNYYILKMSPEMRSRLITPAIRKVTGHLYLDQWNGRDFAHLDVVRIEPADTISEGS